MNLSAMASKKRSQRPFHTSGVERKESMAKCEKAMGLSDTRLHSIWTDMKQRCYNPMENNKFLVSLRIRKGWNPIRAITEPVNIEKRNRRQEKLII
jgi:hypothetical protein